MAEQTWRGWRWLGRLLPPPLLAHIRSHYSARCEREYATLAYACLSLGVPLEEAHADVIRMAQEEQMDLASAISRVRGQIMLASRPEHN